MGVEGGRAAKVHALLSRGGHRGRGLAATARWAVSEEQTRTVHSIFNTCHLWKKILSEEEVRTVHSIFNTCHFVVKC